LQSEKDLIVERPDQVNARQRFRISFRKHFGVADSAPRHVNGAIKRHQA